MSKQNRPGSQKTSSRTGTSNRPSVTSSVKFSEKSSYAGQNSRKKPAKNKEPNPILVTVGVLAVVAAIIAVIIIAPWQAAKPDNSSATTSATSDENLTPIEIKADPDAKIELFPNEGNTHVQAGTKVQYNTNPPTSGNHYPTWSKWGYFPTAQADELMVHNLEHGGVIMYYDCPQGCSDAIKTLQAYALRYQPDAFTGVIVTPRSNLPNGARIALVAWQSRMLLKSLDTAKINDFMTQRFNKAPEADPNTMPFR